MTALAQIRTRLRSIEEDRTTDESVITVSAALVDAALASELDPATTPIVVAPAGHAAIAHFGRRPSSTADAWIALDAELETEGLRATGPYRQTFHANGAVTLATPVAAASECS